MGNAGSKHSQEGIVISIGKWWKQHEYLDIVSQVRS